MVANVSSTPTENYQAMVYSKVAEANSLDPKTAQTIGRIKDEITVQLAEKKVECLKDVLSGCDLTPAERNEVQKMYNDANKEWIHLKQQFNIS